MNINTVYNKIMKFASRTEINMEQLKKILLSDQDVRVYSRKLDGSNLVRDFNRNGIQGPNGRAMRGVKYWLSPFDYMILWSETDNNFRTIVLSNVEKIRFKNKTYLVKKFANNELPELAPYLGGPTIGEIAIKIIETAIGAAVIKTMIDNNEETD